MAYNMISHLGVECQAQANCYKLWIYVGGIKMKVKGICYFVLSQYSVLVGLNIHAVNRPQGAYYLYPFEDPCSTLFCYNVYWCRLVWSGNVCGIQTMNEL